MPQHITVEIFKRAFKLILIFPPWWVVFHDDFFGLWTLGFWSKWSSGALAWAHRAIIAAYPPRSLKKR